MSNFFEQELRKLFEDGKVIQDPVFVGRACLGGLDAGRQVRAEFVTMGHADHYEALRLTLLDNDLGVVDKLTLRLKDVWGKKAIPNNPYLKSGVAPHIWVDGDRIDWYAYHPTQADLQVLRRAADDYLHAFRERAPERVHNGPKLVYICAPLRGEVAKNIEFARQSDPAQDQAARDMGLRLVEVCQQVNVYGPNWTEGMWAEIQHAEKLGIPVMTDQKAPEKTQSRPKLGRNR